MSQAARHAGNFAAAIRAAELAIMLAQQMRDSHTESVGYIALADALRWIGDLRGASDTLATAGDRATVACDRTWISLKRALCLVELRQDELAMAQLAAAARDNERCKSRDVSMQVASNQAWLLRKREPAGALARLDELATLVDEDADALLLRSYIAADRGALDDAERWLERAESLDLTSSEWRWESASARGELSEARGGPLGDVLAEVHYRRATAMVVAERAGLQDRSAFLVANHRVPYDALISLLARNGRWRDALAVVLDLDASDMLRATADERIEHDRQVSETDAPAHRPVTALPPRVDAVLSAWRDRDLVILLARSDRQIGPKNERVVRLRVSDGEVSGEDVGDAKAARKWADDLFRDPGNQEAARALGTMMVPPGSGDRALHVLAIGPLGKVPLAALRDGDGSLIAGRRPLVRVLALRATRSESRGAGKPVVIADPRGDLVGAAVEGDAVAHAVGPEVRLSGSRTAHPATRAALWTGRDATLLHVAGHVVAHGRWRVLPMADGEVDPSEMLEHGLAPRLAVVASCGSAAATDEEGWGSIAAALLEAGTAAVVATDRRVDDGATLEMMRAFYAQPDWRADPARALARVQAHDAEAGAAAGAPTAETWAAFSVLGRPPFIP
jgi:tetratricopeptide (TPR) repeat protein